MSATMIVGSQASAKKRMDPETKLSIAQTVGATVGGGIMVGGQVWLATICFAAGGPWAVLGVLLCFGAFGSFLAYVSTLGNIWS